MFSPRLFNCSTRRLCVGTSNAVSRSIPVHPSEFFPPTIDVRVSKYNKQKAAGKMNAQKLSRSKIGAQKSPRKPKPATITKIPVPPSQKSTSSPPPNTSKAPSLVSLTPDLVSEFHPTKNGVLTPDQILVRIPPVVLPPRHRSLAADPKLAAEFHPTKNGALTPRMVFSRSGTRVWWRCTKHAEHEWETDQVDFRSRYATGCPFCVGMRVSRQNCLAAVDPEIAEEWHPTKNGDLRPTTVHCRSARRIWWQCRHASEHQWRAQVVMRTRTGYRTGCPYCSFHRLTPENSMLGKAPEVSRELHPTKNGGLKASDIHASSNRPVWWQCVSNPRHEWRTKANKRTRSESPTGCPYCHGHRVLEPESLAQLHPDYITGKGPSVVQFHPSRNTFPASQLSPLSRRRVWWRCARGHEWQESVRKRVLSGSDPGCPQCIGTSTTSPKPIYSPFMMKRITSDFHPTKNGLLDLATADLNSSRKVWWRCRRYEAHQWQTCLNRYEPCPYCKGKTVAKDESFHSKYPKMSAEFHRTKNGCLDLATVRRNCSQSVWWQCSHDRAHQWEALIHTRACGKWACPYCNGKIVTEDRSLARLFPALAAEFNPSRNSLFSASHLSPRSTRRVWWRCARDHEWQDRIRDRIRFSSGCPQCEGHSAASTPT
eukprot:245032_1